MPSRCRTFAKTSLIIVRSILLATWTAGCCVTATAADWPEFLGPLGRGVATEAIRMRWS